MADDFQSTANSNDFDSVLGTNPSFGFQASDILHSANSDGGGNGESGDSSAFTGIGDLGVDFSAPTVIGVSSSSDSHDYSSDSNSGGGNGGGLLGGLL